MRFGRAVAVAALVATTLVASACIPATVRPTREPVATPSAAASSSATAEVPDPSGSTTSGVRVDGSLLALLPAAVDGVPLTADPATAAEIAADGSVAPFVDAVAVATAFGPIASDASVDYVVVTLAHLRPDAFGSAFHRVWRDTFDEAVCAQAGGVDGNAEADIAGHRTFIGTCAGGVRTYHIHLPGSDVLVSMQAAGERRFGEQVVAGLTE